MYGPVILFVYSLQFLSVDKNPLSSVLLDRHCGDFPKLERLSLCDTFINEWSSVDSLYELKALHTLRMQRTRMTIPSSPSPSPSLTRSVLCSTLLELHDTYGVAVCRSMMIGRLPLLSTLNRSSISKRERSDAEQKLLRVTVVVSDGGGDGDIDGDVDVG